MQIINSIQKQPVVRRYGLGIATGLAFLCLILIGVDIYKDIRLRNYQKKVHYTPPTPKKTTTDAKYQIQTALRANLLGDPNKQVARKPEKAPQTTLKLVLQGILYSSIPEEARAIIKNSKQVDLYSVGEKITSTQVTVEDIRQDEILLNRSGVIESLPLVKKRDSGNRKIVSYISAEPDDFPSEELLTQQPIRENSGVNTPQTRPNTRPQPNEPRTIKRPNFSGLDLALEKLGEL